jgi:hypothetical protein
VALEVRAGTQHAGWVIDTVQAPLGQRTCRDRLASSRRGFLACTRSGLPTVLPVALRAQDGQLMLAATGDGLTEQLLGQVVALTIGRSAFRYRRGWSVTAHGRMGRVQSEGWIPLEIAQLEGVTVVHPKQRSYS